MRAFRLSIILALLGSLAGCSLCKSYRATGYFPELELVAPKEWPDLRMMTSDADIALRYTAPKPGAKRDLSVKARLVISEDGGVVQSVESIETDDAELREKIRNALSKLSFYLKENRGQAVSYFQAPSNLDTDGHAPSSQPTQRKLPERLDGVQVVVKFIYRDYEHRDNCWK